MQDVHLSNWTETGGTNFLSRATHRAWLLSQATALLDFYRPNVLNPAGGFYVLDDDGRPLQGGSAQNGAERQLHDTTRMVHCFAMAKLWGQSGVDDVIDHGMDLLWTRHRDAAHGGYFWGVDDSGPTNPAKQAYGHAFVMLAAASAKAADHPDADRLLADVSEVLQARFWEESCGAAREEYSADWQVTSDYRGQNSNMHLTEALMAAYEVTGEQSYLGMAQRIAGLIVNRHARHQDWRIAEHFDQHWQVDREYAGNPVFRPRGITPGHALEWSRLLIQLWELGARQQAWLPDAAKRLFFNAIETGWNAQTGGFYYTLDWNNTPDQADRFWWPCAEGIAAAAVLGQIDDDPRFEIWYRRIWDFVDTHFIDHSRGGWFHELDTSLKPAGRVFTGKPDIYHALQACIIPLLPADGGIIRGLLGAGDLGRPSLTNVQSGSRRQ